MKMFQLPVTFKGDGQLATHPLRAAARVAPTNRVARYFQSSEAMKNPVGCEQIIPQTNEILRARSLP